jgi:hypothetical protein
LYVICLCECACASCSAAPSARLSAKFPERNSSQPVAGESKAIDVVDTLMNL